MSALSRAMGYNIQTKSGLNDQNYFHHILYIFKPNLSHNANYSPFWTDGVLHTDRPQLRAVQNTLPRLSEEMLRFFEILISLKLTFKIWQWYKEKSKFYLRSGISHLLGCSPYGIPSHAPKVWPDADSKLRPCTLCTETHYIGLGHCALKTFFWDVFNCI